MWTWYSYTLGLCGSTCCIWLSLSRPTLMLLLASCGILWKIISLIYCLYDGYTSCVSVGNRLSPWFVIASGVRQGCVIAPDSFVSCDWYGLVTGKVSWKGHEWNRVLTSILHQSWLCRWRFSPYRAIRAHCSSSWGSPRRRCSTWSGT